MQKQKLPGCEGGALRRHRLVPLLRVHQSTSPWVTSYEKTPRDSAGRCPEYVLIRLLVIAQGDAQCMCRCRRNEVDPRTCVNALCMTSMRNVSLEMQNSIHSHVLKGIATVPPALNSMHFQSCTGAAPSAARPRSEATGLGAGPWEQGAGM